MYKTIQQRQFLTNNLKVESHRCRTKFFFGLIMSTFVLFCFEIISEDFLLTK
jgi:hypothetical protein